MTDREIQVMCASQASCAVQSQPDVMDTFWVLQDVCVCTKVNSVYRSR